MAGTTTNANADLVRKNLFKASAMYMKENPQKLWDDMVAGNDLTSDQLYEKSALVSGIGLPQIRLEYQKTPITTLRQVATKTHTPLKRTLQFRMSDEFFINEQYGYAKSYGQMLAHVYRVAKEIAGAIFLNGANSTSYLSTPQSNTYAATTHVIETGTDANKQSSAASLGVIALENAVQFMKGLKAFKGYTDPHYGPFNLECSTGREMLAKRLVGATKLAESADNDPNPVSSTINKVVANPYFENAGWWDIHSTNAMENKRFFLSRYGFKITDIIYDGDDDSWKVTAKESYIFDILDYRDTWFELAS